MFLVTKITQLQRTGFFSNATCVPMLFLSVRPLSVLRGHSGFFIPATTANDLRLRRISIPERVHYIIVLS